jgi:hypothetical protein
MKELEIFLYKLYELQGKYEIEYHNIQSSSYSHTGGFRNKSRDSSMFITGRHNMLKEIINMIENKDIEKPPFIRFTIKERLNIFFKGKL